jgi:hypothetical protein
MARGRLGSRLAPPEALSDEKMPCKVSAELGEDGEFHLSVSATGEYVIGGRVGASFDFKSDEAESDIPHDLAQKVYDALNAVLEEAHEELKEEFQRERNNAIGIHAAAASQPAGEAGSVEVGGQA